MTKRLFCLVAMALLAITFVGCESPSPTESPSVPGTPGTPVVVTNPNMVTTVELDTIQGQLKLTLDNRGHPVDPGNHGMSLTRGIKYDLLIRAEQLSNVVGVVLEGYQEDGETVYDVSMSNEVGNFGQMRPGAPSVGQFKLTAYETGRIYWLWIDLRVGGTNGTSLVMGGQWFSLGPQGILVL